MVEEMRARVVLLGLGSLGVEMVRVLQRRKEFELVGVVDTDSAKVGKDAGTLALGKKIGVSVSDIDSVLKKKPDVVVQATTSHLEEASAQISAVMKKAGGASIISTCEELVYPYVSEKHKKLAGKLDILTRRHGATILGVGVNPGFVMDSLVLALTSVCSKVERIRVERVVDVSKRRRALQQKMCLGRTVKEFEDMKKAGHVGLLQSAMMICDSLNVKASFTSVTRPVIANRSFLSNGVTIEQGRVAGLEHRLIGRNRNVKFIEMILYMYAGASEFDLIEIEGTPPVYVRTNGIQGDQATIALLLNYIPIIMNAEPGLHTVKDLPVPHFRF
jgi:4-hydroxy-tetrahydrodipicolinate reductase